MVKAIIIAVMIILAIVTTVVTISCCKVSGECSREEERKERENHGL